VLDEVLGEGAYSIVRPAISKTSHEKVAVKIINKAGLSAEDEKDLKQEVSILKRLRHPNIVKLVDFFEEPLTYIIVMEYIEGGELFDRIIQKNYYTEKEARDCVFAMLSAVKYIHDRDIVHRDLKPENLLLQSMSDDADVKIADFGFSSEVNGENLTQQCGTPGYVAPEILAHKTYGKPVDMWSLGVIMYILLGGYPPFHHENQKELFKLIMAGKFEFHAEFWVSLIAYVLPLLV
jgi:calcium/calmodulin-dependent protein kinase I